MRPYTDILRSVSPEKFSEILHHSSRKAREVYFHRHDIRPPKTSSTKIARVGAKNEARLGLLYDALRQSKDDELAEEVLRTWLLTKRSMLGAAMDHLGIPHQDGLTESDDVAKIEKLDRAELKAIAAKLEPHATRDDIVLYLKFMGAEGVDEALRS